LNEKELKFKMESSTFFSQSGFSTATDFTTSVLNGQDAIPWPDALTPIDLPVIGPEIRSLENDIQLKRESMILGVLLFKKTLPHSPTEPTDSDIVSSLNDTTIEPIESKLIPLEDTTLTATTPSTTGSPNQYEIKPTTIEAMPSLDNNNDNKAKPYNNNGHYESHHRYKAQQQQQQNRFNHQQQERRQQQQKPNESKVIFDFSKPPPLSSKDNKPQSLSPPPPPTLPQQTAIVANLNEPPPPVLFNTSIPPPSQTAPTTTESNNLLNIVKNLPANTLLPSNEITEKLKLILKKFDTTTTSTTATTATIPNNLIQNLSRPPPPTPNQTTDLMSINTIPSLLNSSSDNNIINDTNVDQNNKNRTSKWSDIPPSNGGTWQGKFNNNKPFNNESHRGTFNKNFRRGIGNRGGIQNHQQFKESGHLNKQDFRNNNRQQQQQRNKDNDFNDNRQRNNHHHHHQHHNNNRPYNNNNNNNREKSRENDNEKSPIKDSTKTTATPATAVAGGRWI
jgi:hypothetical protein